MRPAPWRLAAVLVAVGATSLTGGCRAAEPKASPHDQATDRTGSVVVVTTRHAGTRGATYVEGAVEQVSLRSASGTDSYTGTRQSGRKPMRFPDLALGDYTFHAALRPCDANCGNLDAPTDGCFAAVHVGRAPVLVEVDFHVGESCRVQVSH